MINTLTAGGAQRQLGGAERQLLEVAGRSRLNHEIVEVSPVAARRDVLVGLARELRARRPDVVVAWLPRPQLATALVAPPRVRLVAALRGLPNPERGAREQWRLRLALRRYQLLVANSAAVREATMAWATPLSLSRVMVIPNGVEEALGRRVAPAAMAAIRIGFIGRGSFDPDKGLDVLLSALARFPDGEVRATLVGRGVPETVGVAGAHGDDVVLGAVEDGWGDVRDVDVLVVPSRREGSPNVVLEAFVRGIPVIGTTSGGTRELLASGRGVLVPPEDPKALAEAIRDVALNPGAAARRATAARCYALRVHAWPRIVAAYDNLFVSLLRDDSDNLRYSWK